MFAFARCCLSVSLHQSSGTWQGSTQQTEKSHSHTTYAFLVKFVQHWKSVFFSTQWFGMVQHQKQVVCGKGTRNCSFSEL